MGVVRVERPREIRRVVLGFEGAPISYVVGIALT